MQVAIPKYHFPYPVYDDGTSMLGPRYGQPGTLFSPFELDGNLKQVRRMNRDDCQKFLDHREYQRIMWFPKGAKPRDRRVLMTPIRDMVRQRLRECKQADREFKDYRKFERHIRVVYERLMASARLLAQDVKKFGWHSEIVDEALQVEGLNSRNVVFDCPNVDTGLISVKAHKRLQDDKSYAPTAEHPHPRTKSGEDIAGAIASKLIKGDTFNIENFVMLLFAKCIVTFTTNTENEELRTFMKNNPNATPEEAYRACGIKLVRVSEIRVPWQWNKLFEHYKIELPDIQIPNFDIIPSLTLI